MELLFFWFVFMALIGWWADQWKRSIVVHVLLAFLFSPIVAGIVLLVRGRNTGDDA
jgi:hypothetical protein